MNKSSLTPKADIHKKAKQEVRFSFWLTKLHWCCNYVDKSRFLFSSHFCKPKWHSSFTLEVTALTDVVLPITKRKDAGNKQQVME